MDRLQPADVMILVTTVVMLAAGYDAVRILGMRHHRAKAYNCWAIASIALLGSSAARTFYWGTRSDWYTVAVWTNMAIVLIVGGVLIHRLQFADQESS